MVGTVNEQKLRGMKPGGGKLTESLPGRGMGSLIFKRQSESPPMAFYRYRLDGKDCLIKIGVCKLGPRAVGLPLPEIRDRARELAKVAIEHGDVRAHLQDLENQAELERIAREKEIHALRVQGSFEELFREYIEDRRGRVRDDQISEFERILKVDLLEAHPQILAVRASEVRPQHIRQVLETIWNRGSTRQAEKVRSFLRAAFQFGMIAEHSLGRSSTKNYSIESNPVDAVLVPSQSNPRTRVLTDSELKQFWWTITQTDGIGPVVSRLFQFVLALGGQRIEQVAREPWTSYDMERRILRLIDKKGRGESERIHLVPLTDRAMEILGQVESITGNFPWPWTSYGKKPFATTTFAHVISDWLESRNGKLADTQIPHFTPRDLRRTCAQLMQRSGINDEVSDLLQSHGRTGVVAQHYRNNPEAYLPEKTKAINAFDKALSKAIK
ncbi:MAG: tyrosine-type recombinase/integrase [Pseudomonadaceae bacterium]|nr:tyrosine-type recombinase/integrase [Pseudomonadaceae bacterium]